MPIKRSTASKNAVLPPLPPDPPQKATAGSTRVSPLVIGVIAVVLVAAIALGIKQTWFSHKAAETANPQTAGASAQDEVKSLVAKVTRHIMCRPGEEPTVATVQDVAVLQKQNPVFYKDAKNGDRLLIWSDKAVLYSPTQDIVLAVLPINLPATTTTNQQVNPAPAQNPAPETATIDVRNGSGVSGLGKTLGQKLTQAGLTVLKPTEAVKKDYAQTIIVKLNDKSLPQTLQAIQAATKNAQIVSLPAGEKASTADFLIIVGADLK